MYAWRSMRFPVALLPCPHLVFSVFYKCSHSVGCVVSSCGVNICIYLITNGGTPFLPFFFWLLYLVESMEKLYSIIYKLCILDCIRKKLWGWKEGNICIAGRAVDLG